jgi:hypothetical protein
MRRRWSGLPRGHSRSNFLKGMGAVMQCLACKATNKMLLMDVVRDDTMKVPVIEHQIYMCSSCRSSIANVDGAVTVRLWPDNWRSSDNSRLMTPTARSAMSGKTRAISSSITRQQNRRFRARDRVEKRATDR